MNHNFGAYWSASFGTIMKDPINWALIGIVGFLALGCGMWGGFHYCYLKAKAGQKPEIGDVLYPFKSGRALDLFLGALIAGIAGPFTQAIWGFNTSLQVDRGLTFQQAMETGKQETGKGYVPYLIFFFVNMLILYIPFIGGPIAAGFALEASAEKLGPLQLNAVSGSGQLGGA